MGPQAQVRIVGTSHISESSAREIERAFDEFDPQIVAVELDARRLRSLKNPPAGGKGKLPASLIRQVGIGGYLFLAIGSWVQRRLAGIVKVQPGIDMLRAVELAEREGRELLLADRDILVTIRRLVRKFSWRERLRMAWDVLSSPLRREKVLFDLRKVPDAQLLEKILSLLKERYPSLYEVLIVERNVAMASSVDRFSRLRPGARILLVVGAGHEKDLRERLKRSGRIEVC